MIRLGKVMLVRSVLLELVKFLPTGLISLKDLGLKLNN